MRRHRQIEIATEVLGEFGIKPRIVPGGKHLKLQFEVSGRRLQYIVSHSPSSNWRDGLNTRANLRRLIRTQAHQ
jgi:hypothetical protein